LLRKLTQRETTSSAKGTFSDVMKCWISGVDCQWTNNYLEQCFSNGVSWIFIGVPQSLKIYFKACKNSTFSSFWPYIILRCVSPNFLYRKFKKVENYWPRPMLKESLETNLIFYLSARSTYTPPSLHTHTHTHTHTHADTDTRITFN